MNALASTQAMLLAAGLGTRLRPLTADRAKPAVPFLGKPLIAHGLQWLAQHGVCTTVINTHYRHRSVEQAVLGFDDIYLSPEPEILGTAGGLGLARERGLLGDKTTIVVNAKLFTDIDLERAYQAHRRSGAAITLVLRRNPERAHFREVLVQDSRVVGFGAGRVPSGENPLLFTGIHLLEPEVLATIAPRFSDTVADVYPTWIERGAVGAHIADEGLWWEFSTLERYVDLHASAHARGIAPDNNVDPTATIHPAAQLKNVVAWENVTVPEDAILERAVLCAGVSIPAGARLSDVIVARTEVAGGRAEGAQREENGLSLWSIA